MGLARKCLLETRGRRGVLVASLRSLLGLTKCLPSRLGLAFERSVPGGDLLPRCGSREERALICK